jgi:GntR family transcriptional regulator, transcriptional repressor for pyruvate dehydrogenase complex
MLFKKEDILMKFSDVVLSREKVSDQIKDALKQAILTGEFKAGDKLPREDQIAVSFKVSKASVREALRGLEGEGIVDKRRGIHGGNFVAQPGISKMNDLMSNYYQFGTVTAEELLEFGLLLEPTLVPLSVQRRTDEDLEKMRANIQEREEGLRLNRLNVKKMMEFHHIIADSCRNQLISALIQALVTVSFRILPRVAVTRADSEAHLAFSKELYKHLRQRNERAAQKSMAGIFKRFYVINKRKNAISQHGLND